MCGILQIGYLLYSESIKWVFSYAALSLAGIITQQHCTPSVCLSVHAIQAWPMTWERKTVCSSLV